MAGGMKSYGFTDAGDRHNKGRHGVGTLQDAGYTKPRYIDRYGVNIQW